MPSPTLLDLLDGALPQSCGKTSPASSASPTTRLDVSWERLSAQMMPYHRLEAKAGPVLVWFPGHGHGRHGGFSTLNISDSPNDGSACLLSSILETGPIRQRYYLSPRAARGIIRRAVRRGKSLPPEILAPLVAVRFGAQLPRLLRILGSAFPELQERLGGASQSGGFRTTDLDNNGALIPELAHALRREGHDASEDGTGRGTPLIPDVAWALQERDAKGADSDTKEGHLIPVCFDTTQITSSANFSRPRPGDPAPPLTACAHPLAVAMNLRGREGGAMPELDDKASIRAASGGSSRSYVAFHGTQDPDVAGDISPPLGTNHGRECGIAHGWAVRRLTPVECARLQGFPDNHTRIAWRGKPQDQCPDGPQYKAFGNAMAVPVVRWILTRMGTAMEKPSNDTRRTE